MTKFKEPSLESFIKNGATGYKAVLFYGSDNGLIDEYRQRVGKAVCPDLKDAFRVASFSASAIEDPAIVVDEINAISFLGGRRVVFIKEANNTFTNTFKNILSEYKSDALIVVTAGELKTKDSLPAFFEKETDLAVFPCYADEGEALLKMISKFLMENKKTASNQVIQYIAENLGADRMLSKSELTKLVTFVGNSSQITMDDVTACLIDASALSIDQLQYAITGGQQKIVQETLDKLFASGETAISILRMIAAHLKKFQITLAKISSGIPADTAIAALHVFYKKAPVFKEQIRKWSPKNIASALDTLVKTEIQCKQKNIPTQLLVSRALIKITALYGKK